MNTFWRDLHELLINIFRLSIPKRYLTYITSFYTPVGIGTWSPNPNTLLMIFIFIQKLCAIQLNSFLKNFCKKNIPAVHFISLKLLIHNKNLQQKINSHYKYEEKNIYEKQESGKSLFAAFVHVSSPLHQVTFPSFLLIIYVP